MYSFCLLRHAAHLRDDRYKHVRDRIPGLIKTWRLFILMRDEGLTIEDGRVAVDDRVFVDWFIAMRWAGIDNAT